MSFPPFRVARGRAASHRGEAAEAAAAAALEAEGWKILARRLRTEAGEIDLLAERTGILAVVEVKARPRLDAAAAALTLRQRRRLLAATEIILAQNPELGREGVRCDVILVDAAGRVRRITDAFRDGDTL